MYNIHLWKGRILNVYQNFLHTASILISYLELFHIVRVEAGSAYMIRTDWTTNWSGVKPSHLLPTTTSKQVIHIFLLRHGYNGEEKYSIPCLLMFIQVASCFTRYPIIKSWPLRSVCWTAYESMRESVAKSTMVV